MFFLRGLTSLLSPFFFFFNDTATTEIYTLSLHDALPIYSGTCSPSSGIRSRRGPIGACASPPTWPSTARRSIRPRRRSEEHTSELQSRSDLVCRLLLEKKKKYTTPVLTKYDTTPRGRNLR